MSLTFNSIPQKSLTQSITSASSTFKLNNIKSWAKNSLGINIDLTSANFGTTAYGIFRNATGTIIEIFSFDPTTIASSSITILKRGLDFNGDLTTETTNYKLDWPAGTVVMIGTDAPQIFQYLKEYIDGIAISGSPDASETAKGIVEEATDAEVTAGTSTGGTGAKLFITPTKLQTYTEDKVKTITVNLSSADILALNSSPKELLPAPGSGKLIVLENITVSYTYVSIAYTSGGNLRPVWRGSTVALWGTGAGGEIVSSLFTTASSGVKAANPAGAAYVSMLSNTAIDLYANTANFATGNGTAKVFIKYRTITL
tara:strand:+ start:5059 stop:6000 length:942 start_codon:yes stop_codon:yes gene_type:complete